MNCSEVGELLGNAVDGALPSGVHDEFFNHLRVCRTCQRSYELETVAKSVVQNYCRRVPTPPNVAQAVVASIERAAEAPPSLLAWIHDAITVRRLVPALLASIAVTVFLVFFNQQPEPSLLESDAHTASNDVIFQSLQNFDRLQKGELIPARTASKAEIVHQYLDSSGMDFAVVHTMDCCKSYGAALSEYAGVRLAHIIYTLDGDIMYVYQVKKTHVLEGSTLILPPAARTALQATGWYTDPRHPNCNVVLWISNETLCVAVSSMKKDEMLAMLNQN